MARGAAGERLSQLEAAIAQLGARLRRLEESSSARASALEQRLGRLEHSLARARHAPVPVPVPHDVDDDAHTSTSTARARSLESILIANGISFTKEAFSKTNPSSPENETKNYSGFERGAPPPVPSSRAWEAARATRRGGALEMQRRLDGVATLRDPGPRAVRSGRRPPLHSAARWGRAGADADVGVAQLLLLERPAAAALDGSAGKPLRLAESSAAAHAVAAYW